MNPVVKKRIDEVEARVSPFYNGLNVIVTGTKNSRIFMPASLRSVSSLGWTLMTYDNPVKDFLNQLPTSECFSLLDNFFMKHNTLSVPGPTYPQFWNYKHGLDILKGSSAKYVFTIGSDCVLERPEGISEIFEILGDGDLISCSTRRKRHNNPFCGTKSFLIKKDAFVEIMRYLEKETYYPFKDIGNMEYRFGLAIDALGVIEIAGPNQPDEDQFAHSYNEEGECIGRGTWGKILGFRHLGGEHKIRKQKKIIPIEEKFFDKRFMSHSELETLGKYWETGDKLFIKKWWGT